MLSGSKAGSGTGKINGNRRGRGRAMLAAASAATVGITALVQTPAMATTYTWNNTGTAWNNAADWSVGTGYPGSTGTTDIAVFNGPAGAFLPNLGVSLSLAQFDFALTNSSGYTVSSNSSSVIFTLTSTGTGASSAIFANNSSGMNTISAPLLSGAANTYTQATGGTLNVTGGITAAGTGEALTLAGGGVFNFSTTAVNINGTGTATTGGILGVGTIASSEATLHISSNVTALDLSVGNGTGTLAGGAVYQTGGALTLTDTAASTGANAPDKDISLGGTGSTGTGGYGYYSLSAGTLTANSMDIGARANGTVGVMDVSGGTVSIAGGPNMGRGNGSGANYGLLNITGGNVNFAVGTSSATVGMGFTGTGAEVINVGGGSGTAQMSGGSNTSSGIEFTVQTAIENEVNLLTNGTLTIARIYGASANATALVNFNGGDLKATAINAGSTFLTTNIGAVTVYGNGGTIDNSGTNITIGNALVAPAGSGVTSITPSGGAGYIGAPFVYISGGGGTGATAYAVMSGGTISNIVITNPGTGYTSVPTVTLVGGGASTVATATAGTPATNSNTGGMTFVGSGTTTLSGANTYAGQTTVSAGTLQVASTGSLAGSVVVSPSATFVTAGPTTGATSIGSGGIFVPGAVSYNGSTAIPTVTLSATGIYNTGPLTLQKTSVVDFAFNSSANAEINVTGALTLNGGILDFTNSGAATAFNPATAPSTYTLIAYSTGQFNGSIGNFTVANAQPGKAYSFANTGSAITLTIANSSGGTWTNNTTDELWTDAGNWVGSSIPNAVSSTANFGSSLANSDGNVNLANTNETVGSLIFDNTSTPGNVSFTIEATGTGTLILDNGTGASPGVGVVAGAHTISAPLQLNAPSSGTTFTTAAGSSLTLSGSISNGSDGAQTANFAGAGTVILTGTSDTLSADNIAGGSLQVGNNGSTGTLGSASVNISPGANLTFALTSSPTITNNITGANGTVIQAGTGTVLLAPSAPNTFGNSSGGLVVLSGGVQLGNANAVPTGLLLNMSGGTLDLNSNNTTVGSLIGGTASSAGGVITDNSSSAGTTTLTDNWAGAVQTYYGTIANGSGGRALALNISGGGTVALAGSNSYTGGTNFTAGTLEALSNNAVGTGTVTLSASAGSFQISNGVTLANNIVMNAGNPGSGKGAITTVNNTDTATYSGTITINAITGSGGAIAGPTSSGLLSLTGPLIAGGTATSIVIRSGYVQLADTTGNSSYPLLILDTTAVSLGHNNGVATNAVLQLSNTGSPGNGQIDLNGYNQTLAGITQVGGTGVITNTYSNLGGNSGAESGPNGTSVLTINTSATTYPDATPDTYAGAINSYVQLIKTGAGTLALSNTNNSYLGGTVIQQGVLAVASLDNGSLTSPNSLGESYIGASDLVFASPGGTLRYTGATTSTSRAFTINDGVTATLDVSTSGATLTDNGSATVDGTETTSPASLAKGPGAGTLVLTGTYPYHGNTIVDGGTLLVTGTTGTTGYGAVSVLSGGTLGGTGTVNGSFNHTAGTIVGGASATVPTSGTLTFTGPVILNGGTDLNNINAASLSTSGVNQQGYITASGGLSFGSTPETVSLQFTGNLSIGTYIYNLFDYSGTLGGTPNLTYTSSLGRASFTTDLSTPGEVNVDINNSGAATLFWNSTSSSAWDVSFPSNASTGTANWYNAVSNVAATKFVQGDNVTFADSGSAAGSGTLGSPLQTNINIASGVTVTPGSITVTANSSNYTINGPGAIGGSGSLTLSGTSTFTLANNNTYTGTTFINGGILSLQSNASLGSLTSISFGGGTLQYSASNTVDYSGQFNTSNNQLISIDTNGQNVTFASNLTSSGGTLTKLGAGTLTLTATGSTFNGGTNISNGTISTGVNIGASSSSVLVGASGNLLFAGTGTITDTNNISGTGNVSNSQVTVITGDNSTFAGTWTANNQYSFNSSANGSGGVPATSANAAYVDNFAANTNGMIFGTTGTYNLGSLSGVATSEARAGNTGNPNVVLSIGNLNTNTTFNGTLQSNASTSATSTLALIKVGTGSLTLGALDGYNGGTTVNGGALIFAAPGAFPNFSSLTIGQNALAAAANHSSGVTGAAKNNLFASSLSIAGGTNAWTGKLDLANNDMVVQNGTLATITNQVKIGYNNGTWNNTGGIVSSSAAADTTHLTALGVIQNSMDGTTTGTVLYTSFDGANAAAATDVLLKYTYYGDANLDGKVDGSDYSRIDNGALLGLTGWWNGDFNYDGVINGSDYTLIDNAFNTQGAQLASQIASPTAQIAGATDAGSSAVPEPTTLGLLGIGALGLLGRRSRRRR